MGLGIKHIHTVQEITRLNDILYHTMHDSLAGSLYKTSLSCLIVEVGLNAPLHTISYKKFGHLATTSLIKSTWEFLNQSQIELRHDLVMQAPCQGNRAIMDVLISLDPSKEQLASLNLCRLFLRAFWLSDSVDGSGTFLLDKAWLGYPLQLIRESSWPRQGKPFPSDWVLWRSFIN
jgi:hypothetical protein